MLLPGTVLLLTALHASSATFTVTNTVDSGSGSLRQSILDANANAGFDTIAFQIPGAGVRTITPLSTLPPLTDPAIIDGTTQPGFALLPLIELNGSSAGGNAGLRLLAGGCTVRGLIINRFLTDGIDISGPGTNVVVGNFIGTDATGLLPRGNIFEGVLISGSSGNLIGGTNTADRNVISGNADAGVYILNGGGNKVIGNFIGTTVAGTVRLGNTNNGVAVYNSSGNTVGGTDGASRNLISGNRASGVYLFGAGSSGNTVSGNYIGTDPAGTLSISNLADGITISAGMNNVIGGTAAGAGNLISGNTKAGLSLGGGASGNLVQGNFIGTDATGKLALGNTLAGVTIFGAGGNQIGGSTPAERNVISGNRQDGIFIQSSTAGNTVAGNFIGVNAGGTNGLANLFNGITLTNAAANLVGGTAPGTGNLISGNANFGVHLMAGANSNLFQKNFIGTDRAGSATLPNLLSGVRVESAANTIGTVGAGNVISGNGQDGLFLVGAGARSNLVQANFIGTASNGTANLGNGRAGVGISGAPANTIGAAGAGNVISANLDAGIYLITSSTAYNRIQGNRIGTDVAGAAALGNAFEGIYVESAPTNTIGGVTAGTGNLISGNHTRGIWFTNASWNSIQGNFIGTAADGISALGNTFHGVECEVGANNNSIGGLAAGAGNRLAFAQPINAGVRIRNGSTNNAILGNSIFSNGALGIDLGTYGVTANDPGDPDLGANMLQNFPLLTQAVSGSLSGVGVRGTLNGQPGRTFLLQFFSSPSCDGTGNGEGQLYLGDCSVATAGDGNVSFVTTFAASVPVGNVLTATATDGANNTSEFSACLATGAAPVLSATPLPNRQMKVSWPNTTSGFALLQTGSLVPPVQWTTVTNVPVNTGGQFVVTLATTATNRFFVLNFQ